MIFSDFYKGPRSPLAKLRPHLHLQQQTPLHTQQAATEMDGNAPEWCRDEYADLLSKDKIKVKNAVKRYLASKVRNDWVFTWPPDTAERPISPPTTEEDEETPKPTTAPVITGLDATADFQDEVNDDPGYQADDGGDSDPVEEDLQVVDDEHDGASIYSVMSEDPIHYQALKEWDSDMPVDEHDEVSPTREGSKPLSKAEREAKKRRALREELKYNEGLACFEARRKAWTDARTVRLRTKPGSGTPISPTRSPRRFFFRRSISGPSSQGQPQSAISVSLSEVSPEKEDSHKSQDRDSTSSVSQNSDLSSYPVATIVPLAPPILPPTNPLRASINPSHYLQLYDKLIVNSLTPSCPVNLSDMVSALVAGWKRDGEWPPRSTIPIDPIPMSLMTASKKKKRASFAGTNDSGLSTRRMSLTGLLSRDKDGTGKGMRQSIQRALGIGTSIDTPVTSQKLNA